MNDDSVRPKTALITILIALALFIGWYRHWESLADQIVLNNTDMVFISPNKRVALDYAAAEQALLRCGSKGGHCGVTVVAAKKTYRSKLFTTPERAKALRDEINRRIAAQRAK